MNFNNMMTTRKNDDEDTIIISSETKSSKKKNQLLFCVKCQPNNKIQLNEVAERVFECPQCKNQYTLGYEIIKYDYDDDFQSSPSDNESIELEGIERINKPILLTADDDTDFLRNDYEDEQKKKHGFYSMNYLKGPGKTIVEETEEWPQQTEQEPEE